MVEVAENDLETAILGAQRVLDRHFDIFKRNERSASRRTVRRLDRLGLHSLATFNEKNGEAILIVTTVSNETTYMHMHPGVSTLVLHATVKLLNRLVEDLGSRLGAALVCECSIRNPPGRY